jgi:hypothetical protein
MRITRQLSKFCTGSCEKKEAVEGKPQFREDINPGIRGLVIVRSRYQVTASEDPPSRITLILRDNILRL